MTDAHRHVKRERHTRYGVGVGQRHHAERHGRALDPVPRLGPPHDGEVDRVPRDRFHDVLADPKADHPEDIVEAVARDSINLALGPHTMARVIASRATASTMSSGWSAFGSAFKKLPNPTRPTMPRCASACAGGVLV